MDKRMFDEMLRKAAQAKPPPPQPDPKLLEGCFTGAVIYKGPREDLKGERALWRREFGKFLVQFNNLSLPMDLTHGWAQFDEADFAFEVDVT